MCQSSSQGVLGRHACGSTMKHDPWAARTIHVRRQATAAAAACGGGRVGATSLATGRAGMCTLACARDMFLAVECLRVSGKQRQRPIIRRNLKNTPMRLRERATDRECARGAAAGEPLCVSEQLELVCSPDVHELCRIGVVVGVELIRGCGTGLGREALRLPVMGGGTTTMERVFDGRAGEYL